MGRETYAAARLAIFALYADFQACNTSAVRIEETLQSVQHLPNWPTRAGETHNKACDLVPLQLLSSTWHEAEPLSIDPKLVCVGFSRGIRLPVASVP